MNFDSMYVAKIRRGRTAVMTSVIFQPALKAMA